VLAVEVIGVSGWESRRRVAGQTGAAASVLWCDGRRSVDLPPGARVEVRRDALPVLLARLSRGGREQAGGALFTDRLVAKFGLPVTGWRGRPAARRRVDGRGAVDGEEDADA
jgi:NAD+ kinase